MNQQYYNTLSPDLRDTRVVQHIADPWVDYTKTLGVEWNVTVNNFNLTTIHYPPDWQSMT